jgi:NADP-dependent 3-hydroxy acid dehydrogenase YdfG
MFAMSVNGKVVVITGASSGLGEATARYLSAHGATVVLAARRADLIEKLAAELVAAGGKALALPMDVTRSAQVQQVVDAAVAQYGGIDVMLNNAGIAPLSQLERGRIEQWDRMVDVNIKGVLYGIAAALPHMKRQRSGHIINVASIAACKITPATAVYSATKAAVRAISEGLRQEVKPYDIRTTVISPGAVATELPDSVHEPDIAEAVKASYATSLAPESFARIVAFVISQPEDVDVNEIVFRPTQQLI